MNLLAAFRRPRALPRRALRLPDWVDPAPPPIDDAAVDAATAAPGSWFDSSWLLRSGVAVIEHATPDPVANDLPLAWWLEGPGAAVRGVAPLSPSSPPCR